MYYLDSSRDNELNQSKSKEQQSIQEESHGDEENNMQLARIPSNQIQVPVKRVPKNFNRLEALKFKMQLQLKNIRLLKDHDLLMRGIEKKQVGGQKRDNKLYNIHQISRLERDIERTSKQLQTEIYNIAVKAKQ